MDRAAGHPADEPGRQQVAESWACRVEQTHEVGIIIRHSENCWREMEVAGDVRIIDFASSSIEQVIREILSCGSILSSSLHGLIMADAYGLPSAWLGTDGRAGGSRPNGGEFKYLDYFASVGKYRRPALPSFEGRVDVGSLRRQRDFDPQPIDFDHAALLGACPFLRPA